MWDRVIDGKVVGASYRPELPNVFDASVDLLNAAGWYEQQRDSAPPSGQYVSAWKWRGVEKGRSVYDPVYADIPEPPPVEPDPRDVEIAALKSRLDKVEGDVTTLKAERVR